MKSSFSEISGILLIIFAIFTILYLIIGSEIHETKCDSSRRK